MVLQFMRKEKEAKSRHQKGKIETFMFSISYNQTLYHKTGTENTNDQAIAKALAKVN